MVDIKDVPRGRPLPERVAAAAGPTPPVARTTASPACLSILPEVRLRVMIPLA